MVFSSLPLYLDPPNWQQQHPTPQNHELQAPNPSQIPPPPPQQGGPTQAGSSMADRARQAKIPVLEGPLKCPRCESTNTKFCYFNNYSLSQPRHFCKTCRRYWTRGGSLRSVPVGGGCRRNKRKKSGAARANSKSCGSPSSKVEPRHQTQSTPPSAAGEFGGRQNHLLQAAVGGAPPPPFSFMAPSLQNLTQLGMGNLGLNFGALGIGGAHNSGSHLGGYGEEEAQQQQLPNLLTGFGTAASLMYPFQSIQGMETASYGKGLGVQNQQLQQGGVKMEGLGVGLGQHQNQNQQQFWSNGGGFNGTSGGLWTDLSGICSSSTSTHNILR